MNTDSVFITGVVDANERRAVEMLDIQNALLHAENDEYFLMWLRGNLSELLVKVDPSLYSKYVITSMQVVPMLYVKLTKAIYGMLRSAMLFLKNLRVHLEVKGFEVNPYDPCVANKLVNGSQMTVCTVPRVANAVTLGPCPRPWRGVVTALPTHFYKP